MPDDFLQSILQGFNMRQAVLDRRIAAEQLAQSRQDALDQQAWLRTQADRQYQSSEDSRKLQETLGLLGLQAQGTAEEATPDTPGSYKLLDKWLKPTTVAQRGKVLTDIELSKQKALDDLDFEKQKKLAQYQLTEQQKLRDQIADNFITFNNTHNVWTPEDAQKKYASIKFPGLLPDKDTKDSLESGLVEALAVRNKFDPKSPQWKSADNMVQTIWPMMQSLTQLRASAAMSGLGVQKYDQQNAANVTITNALNAVAPLVSTIAKNNTMLLGGGGKEWIINQLARKHILAQAAKEPANPDYGVALDRLGSIINQSAKPVLITPDIEKAIDAIKF